MKKTQKIAISVVVACFLILLITAVFALNKLSSSEFVADANSKFGDQHFKTVIALVELHKTRTGNYPNDLKDIKYYGDWDTMALSSVRYVVAQDKKSYKIEVVNGWMGKPNLDYPDEFWKGLGFDKSLSLEPVAGGDATR